MKSLAVFITFLLLLFPASAANHVPDGWCIETQSRENYNGVTLANGRIGLVSGADLFAVSEIVLNGVYDREYAGGVSRLVRAPLYTGLQLKIEGQPVDHAAVSHWKQSLDMRHASLTTSVQYHGVRIEYTLRALRNLPFMSLGEIAITPDKDVDIELVNKVSFPEELRDGKSHFKMMRDAEEAYRLFKKSYIPNRRPPFGVLSESPASNNPYFATGAGGMLQAVLYGFGGLELTDNGVEQRTPVLPKAWKSLTIKGVGMEKKNIIIH